MNKKWSSDKVKDVQRWLIKRWPESFTRGPDLRPLSLQIHKEILAHRDENPQLSTRVVREVIKRHTTSYGYLYGMTKHDKRYNLQGEAVGMVSPEHRDWARSALKVRQKAAQAIRKASRKKIQEQRKTKVAVVPRASAGNTADGPLIRYKPARRKIVKPSTERAVDLAS